MNTIWMMANTCALVLARAGLPFRPNLFTFSGKRQEVVDVYASCDVVISIGAERINDNFYKSLIFALYGYWMANQLGKPVVLYPQTIGPFYFRLSKWITKYVLNKCDLICLRDQRSRRILEELGVKRSRVEVLTDVALLQRPVDCDHALALLANEGILHNGRPKVGISVLKWTYPGSSDSGAMHARYVDVLSRAVDFLTTKLDAQIVFVPTNLKIYGNQQDDVAVAREIINQAQSKNRVSVLSKLYTPDQLKGIIGQFDLCIATRMHAAIFATTMGIPTIAINYQFKLREYMNRLGVEDFSCDIEKLDFDWLQPRILKAWTNRIALSNHLKRRTRELEESVLRAPKLVAEILERT